MTFERSEFIESRKSTVADVFDGMLPQLTQMKTAAASAGLLTGRPEWDIFLGYLQATRDRIESDWKLLGRDLDDPAVTDPGVVLEIKMRRVAMATNLELLDAIMQIPADLVQRGGHAEDIMRKFGDAYRS